ncbi:hypothetical protein B0H10DRAFT_2231334 [Mycena sp. CBHHK59/15]|nr:hypothetical protein B0H10DRAFT_2231334 [Mycena sp. CBHHK59/15]
MPVVVFKAPSEKLATEWLPLLPPVQATYILSLRIVVPVGLTSTCELAEYALET